MTFRTTILQSGRTATGIEVPLPTEEVRMTNGKKNDIYGTVGDACLFTNYFATIARWQDIKGWWVQATQKFHYCYPDAKVYSSPALEQGN